ncbi:lipocalin family protein [Sphingobacterium hungaricum]|uniref:Lipocalin-like domain-containing protein n=1 Tax=Sphingobacterium hungaricum TaxID=2082723 RepID=A0A928YRR7_9SPHI|nr:lipocalin family protein [Sphingobacterium hungaricum]MBE8714957.1 hypothetical protein [Sphingobacterium hungaricum]
MNKFLRLTIALFMLLTVFSCGKDEQDDDSLLILGTWAGVKIDYYENNKFTRLNDNLARVKFTFNSDGTLSITSIDIENENNAGKYTVKDKTLTMSEGDDLAGALVFKILKLTSTELVFAEEYTEDGILYREEWHLKR